MAHVFTDANFNDEVIKSDKPVFVDFWAPWCGPCQMMGPLVEELATELEGKNIKIGKCNVDEQGAVAMEYQVMSIPTFIVFKNGEIMDRFVGGATKEDFLEKLKPFLA